MKLLRHPLVLVALACTAPIVLGWLAYLYGWAPGNAGNYGELVPPHVVRAPPLDALRGKWVMVSFDAAACDAYCEKKLFYMRQVRRAQGKDMDRVERLWVLTDAAAPRAELLAATDGMHVARSADAAFLESFPGRRADHIYVVDPLGNLMMRFPRDPNPSKMLKDFQRLLRASRIG